MEHIEVESAQRLSKYWREIQLAAKKFHAYNILGEKWWENEATLLLCAEFEGLCEGILESLADSDPSVDNMDRFNVFLASFPVGTSYQDMTFFAQDVVSEGFRQFNYGEVDNLKLYGSIEPPQVPLQNLSIPTALFQGSLDRLANPTDVEWLATQIPDALVFREMYPLGHLSFLIALDMSWFSVDVMNLVNQYATNDLALQ